MGEGLHPHRLHGTPSHDGLKLPASLTGLGPRTGQAILVAAWYAGLTPLALAFAYRGRGLGRQPGTVIITGYLAFISALATTITQARVSPPQPQPCQPPSSP